MNTFQKLLLIGIAHINDVPSLSVRAQMLRAAAVHLPEGDVRERCEVTASAIELAESSQLELNALLQDS